MPLRPENLPHETEALRAMVLSLAAENEVLKAMIKQINAQAFGQRSERGSLIVEGQLGLELGDLAEAPEAETEAAAPKSAGVRTKRKPATRNIGRLPSWLPRVIEVIEPAVTTCACCSGSLHKIGEDVAEALDVVPARVRVLRTIRPKYACRACEIGITQAPAKLRLFEGGMATTALVASVAVWKYAWHMPLNRQAHMLAGQGVRLDRATLGKWVKKAAWWLKGLYLRQLEVIHSHPRLYCDETRLPVRKKDRRRTHTGQLWAHAVDDRPWVGPAAPETWAILASLLNTAKLNDIDPFVWLSDVLEQVVSGQAKANDLDRLLAWNWKADRDAQMAAAA